MPERHPTRHELERHPAELRRHLHSRLAGIDAGRRPLCCQRSELRCLLDSVAAVANEELKGPGKGIDGGFDEGEAGHSGGMDGGKVVVVGLDAGVEGWR